MTTTQFAEYSALLNGLAAALDIPDHLYEDAVVRYEDVGNWLGEETSPLAPYSPKVYPQGSFRLGTVIRPITEVEHFDIDLVCRLDMQKEQTTQADLKKRVGDRLKQRADLEEKLEESRRCWNLDYPPHFHMDVLPCLPNPEQHPSGILLTDTNLVRWQKSNPIDYADWFYERMTVALNVGLTKFAEARKADVATVPQWQIRTPLQRVVQLLKRHRNIYFADDQENCPASIIITTLAASAYNNQLDLGESIISVLEGMIGFIDYEDGRYIVRNPVELDENFADKWNEKPDRMKAFFRWFKQVQTDFLVIGQSRPLSEFAETLSPALGRTAMQKAAASLGLGATRAMVPVRQEPAVPTLGSAGHCQLPTWPERLTEKAKIHGGVFMLNRRGKKLWDLSDRAVPKNLSLKFTLTTNARPPYEVKWQVVNTGPEAAANQDLRGDFYSGDGGVTRWETTKYAGTHWVEGFVMRQGTCVARSGRTYVKVR